MNYCGYDFYFNDFYGTKIDGESFPRLAQKASDYIDFLTLGRAKNHSEDPRLKRAVCALAEVYQEIEQAESVTASGEVASESVGSHSITYRSSAETIQGLNAKLKTVADMYLIGMSWNTRAIGVRHVHSA
ncbi:MAG: hypothetical protein KBS60_03185 [Phascolarctobacterium sp.]|nr:hypothetical protein [Candidatus Phascolarctobacterium caballi]